MEHEKRSGFSLVELIAVIAVVSLLITASTSMFLNIRKSILDKEYENLIVYLESKAVEFASKSDITLISVGDLIKEGYVDPDDDANIYDPRNNKSLNCYLIKLEFDNGEYVAEFLRDNENMDENGNCKQYIQTKNYQICQVQNGVCVGSLDNWLNDNVTLGVSFKGGLLNESDGYSYDWSTNTGFTSNDRLVDTFVKRTGQVYYSSVVSKGDEVGKTYKVIKIDKEAPVVTGVKVLEDNSIKVSGTDRDGSGVYGFYMTSEDDACSKEKSLYTKDSFTYTQDGYYKFCAMDNVGNASDGDLFLVDNKVPEIASKGDLTIKVKDNVIIKDNFDVDCFGSKCSITCSIEETRNLDMGVYEPVCTVVRENGREAQAKMKLIVAPKQPNNPNVITYYGGTTNIYSGTKTNKKVDFKVSVGNQNDVVTEYEKMVANGSWVSLGKLDNINSDAIFTQITDMNDYIYVRACCSDGNTKLCSDGTVKKVYIDKTPSNPNVTAYYSSTSNTYDGSFTNKNVDFKVKKGSNEDLVTRYQYKIGNGSWVNVGINSSYEGSFTYSSEVNSTFYVRACYVDGDSTKCSGTVSKTIKIDKTNPTCTVNVTTSGVTITGSDTNLDTSGLSTTNSASYGTTSLGLSKNTFYGFVKDKAGNTGTCSKTIIGTTTTYKKTTSTCNETSTKSYTYDCSKSYDSCTGDWSVSGSQCRLYVGAANVSYTKTSYKCIKKYKSTTYKCSKTYCPYYSKSATCSKVSGCIWKQGACSSSNNASSSTVTYCPAGGTVSGSICYKEFSSACSNGWSSVSSSSNYTYYFDDAVKKTVSSCTKNSIECNSDNYTKEKVICSSASYSCSSGSLSGTGCYKYSSYNGCSSGTNTGSGCAKYGVSSCPSGFSISKTYTNYTYKYSASSSSQSNLSSCSASTGYSSCSGSYSSSQSSMKNKTNVTCTPSVTCSSGYTKLNDTYCYK